MVKRRRRNTEAESTNNATYNTLSRKLLLWQSLNLYTSTFVVIIYTKMLSCIMYLFWSQCHSNCYESEVILMQYFDFFNNYICVK